MSNIKDKKKKTVWFGMKLKPEEKEKIRNLANRKGVTQKQAVMDLVELEMSREEVTPVSDSFYERNKELIGTTEGPRDLSVNPEYLKGYGK